MAKPDVENLTLPQATIKVSVEYYNSEEKELLMAYPTASSIRHLVENGLEIPTSEFLTYYLFRRKRPGIPGFRTYGEISQRIEAAISDLNEFIDFNGQSISTPEGVEDQDPHITERIGESIGLSVVSAIHGLTDADWNRLAIIGGKKGVPSFDYDVAADLNNVIQAEMKGSSTDENEFKTSSISNLKRSIKDKKQTIDELEKGAAYPYPANLRYGTITVIGENPASPVKCLLVDPPAEGNPQVARRIKILSRLQFMRDWITFISPRSQLASALQTRVASVERLIGLDELTEVPLLKGNGERFSFEPYGYLPYSSFFINKSRISDGPAGGVCIPLSEGKLLFLGVRDELLQDAADQNFNVLSQKTYQTGALEKIVECIFSAGRFRAMGFPTELQQRVTSREGYVRFNLGGTIYYSRSGILFGVLPLSSLQ